MKSYQKQIGDGKLPNKYWVFEYNQKYQIKDGVLEIIKEDTETRNSLIGEYKTYKEALNAVDNKACLPNVVIEDRLSGQVFEQLCIVCPCCGKEEYETNNDIKYTKERIEKEGLKFE
jgi:hypothetical protein